MSIMNPFIPITSRTLTGLTHSILLASLLLFPRLSFGQGSDTTAKGDSSELDRLTKELETARAQNEKQLKEIAAYKAGLENARESILRANENILRQNEELKLMAQQRKQRDPNPTAQPEDTRPSGQGSSRPWQRINSDAAENRPDPSYPSAAMKQRLKGKVTVSILVGTNGVPATVATMESSGHELLDQHTVTWVRSRWRWPAGQERRYYCIFEYSMK
jgi:TonB family protein